MAVPSPPDALRTLVERCRLPEAAPLDLESADGGFLAADLVVPAAADPRPRARVNGYAVSPDFAGGRCRFESRSLEGITSGLLPDSLREDTRRAGLGLPESLRVESGEPIPPRFDRVAPIECGIVCGPGIVEIAAADLPVAGAGIERPGARMELRSGTRLDARLRAVLLSRGLGVVMARPRRDVAVATLGEGLIDPAAMAHIDLGDERHPDRQDAGSAAQTRLLQPDLTGFWLPEALRAMGHRAQSFGALSPDPPTVLKTLRRMQRSGLYTAILCGGLGDGIADRTVETLRTGPFRIFFSEVGMDPGGRFLFAQGMGLDVLVLGGAPLDAAIGFDLLVAPLLLHGAGAGRELWDWSVRALRRDAPGVPLPVPLPGCRRKAAWRVLACERETAVSGALQGAPPPARLAPGIPDQAGWLLEVPGGDLLHYCPVRV